MNVSGFYRGTASHPISVNTATRRQMTQLTGDSANRPGANNTQTNLFKEYAMCMEEVAEFLSARSDPDNLDCITECGEFLRNTDGIRPNRDQEE